MRNKRNDRRGNKRNGNKHKRNKRKGNKHKGNKHKGNTRERNNKTQQKKHSSPRTDEQITDKNVSGSAKTDSDTSMHPPQNPDLVALKSKIARYEKRRHTFFKEHGVPMDAILVGTNNPPKKYYIKDKLEHKGAVAKIFSCTRHYVDGSKEPKAGILIRVEPYTYKIEGIQKFGNWRTRMWNAADDQFEVNRDKGNESHQKRVYEYISLSIKNKGPGLFEALFYNKITKYEETLSELVRRSKHIPLTNVLDFDIQLVELVEYLHKAGRSLSDLGPNNTMLKDMYS